MVKEGYLYKQEKSALRKTPHWQKYYCILTADRLDLYEKEGTKGVKFTIKIKDKYVSEGCDNFCRKVDTFKIEESTKKIHYFNCSSSAECKSWMNMLAIHGANPIQPSYQSKEHLFSTDLNDLLEFDDWLKEIKKDLPKSSPTVIHSGLTFIYDKKEKLFIPRLFLFLENGIICYFNKDGKQIAQFPTHESQMNIFTQAPNVLGQPVSVSQKSETSAEGHLDVTLLTPITSILSVKHFEKMLLSTTYSETACDVISKYRFNFITNYDETIMMMAKEKGEILKFIECFQKSGAKVNIKIRHINEDIDKGDFIRDSPLLSTVKDSTKVLLGKGKITESFIAMNKIEVTAEEGEIVDIIENHKHLGIALIRKTDNTLAQGLIPSGSVKELRKKEIPKNLTDGQKKKTASNRRLPDRNTKNISDNLALVEMQHEWNESVIDRKGPKSKPPEMPPYELTKEDKSASFPPPPPRRFTPEIESAFKKVTTPEVPSRSIPSQDSKPSFASRQPPPSIPSSESGGSSSIGGSGTGPKLPPGAFNPLAGRGFALPGLKTGNTPSTPQSDTNTASPSIGSTSTPNGSQEDKSIDNFEGLRKENVALKKQIENEKENSEYLENQLGQLRSEISTLKQRNQVLEKENSENSTKLKTLQGSTQSNDQMQKINSLLDTINKMKDEHQKQMEQIKRQHEEELDRTIRKVKLEIETVESKKQEQTPEVPKKPLRPGGFGSSLTPVSPGGSSSSLDDLKRELEQERSKRMEETRELKEQLRGMSKKLEFEREQLRPLMEWAQSKK